jgi:putative peptidoglycan lipid II flippase
LLYYFLQKQQVYRVSKDTIWFFIKCLISSVLMFVAVYQLQEYFVWQQQGFTKQVILLSGFIVSAVVVYFALLLLMGVRFRQIKNIN